LVFLVGETATSGVHKEALAASLRAIARSWEFRRDPTVLILGPYFSGSQISLKAVIQGWVDQPAASPSQAAGAVPALRIISGSATAIHKDLLEHFTFRANVTFQATVVPETTVWRKLLVYAGVAHEESGDHLEFDKDVAVLYESNTAFGQRTVASQTPLPAYPRKTHAVLFPFPLHISEVRGAYQQTSGPTKRDSLRLPSFGSRLRLPLDEGSRARDTEPSLDSGMTAVTSERMLGSMLSAINNERFHYVLILATDIKDTLFLASLVRQHCPECRLLLSGTDLLFSHPDFSADLRGSLVASTYPLCLRNQSWSPPFRGGQHRFVFPGQPEQGYYNATIALLNPEHSQESLLEYGPPFPDLSAETSPDHPGKRWVPPVWVSIIGQGSLYPVAAFPAEKDGYNGYVFIARSAPLAGADEDPGKVAAKESSKAEFVPFHPTLWLIPVLGMMLLLGYTGFAYRYVVRRHAQWGKSGPKGGSWEIRNLLWPPRSDLPHALQLRRGQQFYACICLLSVLVVYGYLTLVWLIPAGHWLVFWHNSPVELRWWGLIAPALLVALPVFLLAQVALSPLWISRVRTAVLSGWARFQQRGKHALPEAEQGSEDLTQRQGGAQANEPPRPSLGRLVMRYRFLLLSGFLMSTLAAYLVKNGWSSRPSHPGEMLLFFERATSVASGVSPVVPVFLLGLALFLWGYFQLKRLYLLRAHALDSPFPTQPYFAQVDRWHNEVSASLRVPSRALEGKAAPIAWLVLFFVFCRLATRFVPSVDGVVTESALLLALAVLSLLIVYGLLHLLSVWKGTRRLLQAVASLPLGEAFQRIPPTIMGMFGPYLSSERAGRRDHLPFRLEQQRLLAEGYPEARARLGQLQTVLAPAEERGPLPADLPRPSALSLTATARECFLVLQHVWRHPYLAARLLEPARPRPAELAAPAPAAPTERTEQGETGPANSTAAVSDPDESAGRADADEEVRKWLARAQDFVALEGVAYLSQFFVQLRNLALFLAIAPLLLLLAVNSYPFQPQRLWLLLVAVLAGTVTAAVLWIIVQIERDELVSRILKTTPNRLNFHWTFLSQVLLFATPVLGVLVAVSSDLSDLLHAWVDPLLQLLR
jgi:hypothetical protein